MVCFQTILYTIQKPTQEALIDNFHIDLTEICFTIMSDLYQVSWFLVLTVLYLRSRDTALGIKTGHKNVWKRGRNTMPEQAINSPPRNMRNIRCKHFAGTSNNSPPGRLVIIPHCSDEDYRITELN